MRPWFLDPDSPSTCHCGFYTSRFILWVSVSFSGKQGVKSAGATSPGGGPRATALLCKNEHYASQRHQDSGRSSFSLGRPGWC